jgi:hypothetical protein
MNPPTSPRPAVRAWIARAFTATEDVVYIGLGLLLAGSALALLVTGVIDFGQSVVAGKISIIDLIDKFYLFYSLSSPSIQFRYHFTSTHLLPSRSCWSGSFLPFDACWC